MDVAFLTDDDRSTLKNSLLCRAMDSTTLDDLVAHGAVIRLRKSEYIFEQGDDADNLFLILSGWAQIKREESDGSSTLIAVFNQGETLAEAAAFLGKPYPVTAQAMTDMRVFSIDGARLLHVLRENEDVLSASLASLYKKLHDLVNEVESLKSRTIRERLALFLLDNLPVDSGPTEMTLPFGKALIAARIGTSPEQLSRTFRDMRTYGVRIAGQKAIIDDPEKLREMLRRS